MNNLKVCSVIGILLFMVMSIKLTKSAHNVTCQCANTGILNSLKNQLRAAKRKFQIRERDHKIVKTLLADMSKMKKQNDIIKNQVWALEEQYKLQKANTIVAFTVQDVVKSSGSAGKLIFKNVRFNLGGHYNNTTSEFNCPSNGVYFFTLNICFRRPMSNFIFRAALMKGEAEILLGIRIALLTEGFIMPGSGSVLLQCKTGEKIWPLASPIIDKSRDACTNSFSGFLLYGT